MDEPDVDTVMVVAGVLLSLLAASELYPVWRELRRRSQ